MPKKEIVNNDAVTVRVNAAPIKAVEETAEKVLSEVGEAIEQTLDVVDSQVERVVTVTRNNPVLIGAAFVLGAGVAGFVAWKLAEKRVTAEYEERLTQEIEAARSFHKRLAKTEEFQTPESAVEALVPEEVVETITTYQGRQHSAVPYNEPEKIVPAPVEVTVEEVNVTQNNVFVNAQTDPRDWDQNLEVADREANPDQPYVISFEEFHENDPGHEQATLTYYEADDTLTDEKESPIDNTDYTVGDDNLTRFGHGSKDANVVYVRNERLDMDFEIIRSQGSFQQEVLGITPEPELRHSARRRESRRFRGTDE